MRTINQKQAEKDTSPNRFNTDLYIISYKQNEDNLMLKHKAVSPTHQTSPIFSKQQVKNFASRRMEARQTNEQGASVGVADRWRNIDRLVQMLKRGSKSKERDESACGRLFRLIEKMYARYWRQHSRLVKEIGFNRIKAKSNSPKQSPKFFGLKESLEMRFDEIQKGSKNFELNDLMHIVDLHQNEPKVEDKLRNSLSRELITNNREKKEKQVRQVTPSPKKVSSNVYILRRKTKEDLSTRHDLNSNTQISSDNFLPAATGTARSISPHSVNRSKSPNSIAEDPQINLPNANSEINDNKLNELEIDSLKLDKSQRIDYQELEAVSKMKLPSFGINRPSQVVPIRTNRLMNPQVAQKKIVFHYKNSEERSTSPLLNEYFPPETTAKFILPHQLQPKNTTVASLIKKKESIIPLTDRGKIVPQVVPPTRLHRISSLQVLHPKTLITNHPQPNQNNQIPSLPGRNDHEGSVQSRRCYSMPKITFTYKNREQNFVNPSPLDHNFQKNSPIFVLNQLKTSNKNANINNIKQSAEDPYLSKNIQVANITRHVPCEVRPQSTFAPPKNIVYPANIQAENYYSIPVNNYATINPLNNNPSPRPERLKIFSNYQTQPSTSFISNQQQHVRREEYYGERQKLPSTQQTIESPNRQRVRSTDTYVLMKPKPPVQMAPMQQKINFASIQRTRARSCGIKMELVSRRQPMIRVY